MIFQIPLLNSSTPLELWTWSPRLALNLFLHTYRHTGTVGAPLSLQAAVLISPSAEKGAIRGGLWGAEIQTDLSLQLPALQYPGPEPSPGSSQDSPSTQRCCCQSPGKAAARCLHYALLEAGFLAPGAPAQSTRSVVSHPLPGRHAVFKLDCAAREVLGPPVLRTCPAVRYPQPPSRRESERSELAAYLLCMDANGSCLQCISIGALQTAGRPRLPPPGAKGLPSAAKEPRRQAGDCASWAQKTLLELRGLSQSRPAADRRELRLEAGNGASVVRLGAVRPTPGGFPPRLAQAAAPHSAGSSCGQGARSFGGIF